MNAFTSMLSLSSIIVAGTATHAFTIQPSISQRSRKISTVENLFSTAATDLNTQEEDNKETDSLKITIALTREVDKNGKLKEMITSHPTTALLQNSMKVNCIEIPCIEHATGPDLELFKQFVQDSDKSDATALSNSLSNFDYIVITSPESAKVFSDVVQSDNELIQNVKIAAVGASTQKILSKLGFQVDFIPSKANGETLGNELPPVDKVKLNRVIYPASAKAENTIQNILEQRKDASFSVKRFNTYDTVPVSLSDEQMTIVMDDVQIACFGSPSSVDAWLDNVDRILGIQDLSDEDKKAAPGCNGNVKAVCIGSTTAKRCVESGRWHAVDIYYPKTNPGIKGWADSCLQAAGDVMENLFWS